MRYKAFLLPSTLRFFLLVIGVLLHADCISTTSGFPARSIPGNDTAWPYVLDPTFSFHFVSLAEDPFAVNISAPVLRDDTELFLNDTVNYGFVFPFFGVDIPGERIVLSANGFFSFDGGTFNQPWDNICPLPDQNATYTSFTRGFAFYWTDLSFDEGGRAYYRFFPSQNCPYPHSKEACLVVHFDGVYLFNKDFSGDVNGILFAPSGIMLSQVRLYPESSWGAGRGVSFGVQNSYLDVGYNFPNSSCSWANPATQHSSFNSSFTTSGSSFGFRYCPFACPSASPATRPGSVSVNLLFALLAFVVSLPLILA